MCRRRPLCSTRVSARSGAQSPIDTANGMVLLDIQPQRRSAEYLGRQGQPVRPSASTEKTDSIQLCYSKPGDVLSMRF